MALQISSRLQRNSQCGWRIFLRHFKVGEPCHLPAYPYWKEEVQVKNFDEIPGPRPYLLGTFWRYWPIVRSQYSFDKLHETYDSFYNRYGCIVKEKVHPGKTIVHLFHPEDIMSVYNWVGRYPLRRSPIAMERYRRERPHIYYSAGLGSSNGAEWREFREMFNKMFHEETFSENTAVKEQCYKAIEDVTDDLVIRLGQGLDSKGEIHVKNPLISWALESIGMITLNRRFGCFDQAKNAEADRLLKAAQTTHEVIHKTENRKSPFPKWKDYKRLVEAQDYFTDVIRKYIDQQIEASREAHTSLLSLLLSTELATPENVTTLLLDIIHGGIHPVSHTLCFALLNLANNEDKQDKLRKELIREFPTKTESMREISDKVPYVDYVIKETLRMNPPNIGSSRILNSDMVLGGYAIPAGTTVLLQNQVTSMQEEFFKDARVFNPERFSREQMYENIGIGDEVGKFAYKPFGFGQRACIGMPFANMELEFAIAKIVRNYEVTYHHEPVGIINKLQNEPDKPVLLRLKKIEK